jgi:hypothetical protein
MRKTLSERFWEKVNKAGECWEWTACRHHQWGYGHVRVGGKLEAAHRVSWEMHNGPIPDGLLVCHHCDNPKCVRPAHLFLGTGTDNSRDMHAKGRGTKYNTLKTHCPHGHEYTPENTRVYVSKRGWRMRFCIACDRASCRERYAEHRAARRALGAENTRRRRERDPEKFKRQHRDYMRAHRARKKALMQRSLPP